MAIADTVWERLARFNAPYRRNGGSGPESYDGGAALHALASAGAWLLDGLQVLGGLLATAGLLLGRMLFWLLRALGRLLWFRVLPFSARALARGVSASWRAFPGFVLAFRWVILGAFVGLLGWLASVEMHTSHWQAWAFSRLNKSLGYTVEAGAHPIARFPKSGPYDERLGYTRLPGFLSSLVSHRYGIDAQARWSPGLERLVGLGTFPIYREKDQAGLRIFDRGGEQIYAEQFPERTYPDYASMPQLAVRSLLFIEDRYLFDERNPERNPAIEWNRFGLAAATRLASLVVPGLNEGGGSTLATQIEKFRHSPHGVTGGVGEKLRQMLTASTRAYMHGPDTFRRREEIVTTYMNSTPLAAMPGYGEIIGIPEALWVWFGTDHVEATKVLNSTTRNAREMARKGLVYRQVLSLILSERRPSYYLLQNREALAVLTDKYLRVLCDSGIIDPALRDAALDAELTFRTEPPPISTVSWVNEKATQDVRYKLVSLLKLPDLYSLDRLDLTAESSVDTAAQGRITAVMQRLNDPAYLRQAGLIGHQLLGDGNPAKLTWSFVLYERGRDRNHVRIHADSANRPFDLNSGAKLQLGSTAKLRTMITYLTVIAELHGKLSGLPVKDLQRTGNAAEDPLTQWAAGYLARSRDRSLQPMLDAAMQRTYSGAPDTFFTGGGNQSFGNFASWEDSGAPTVENAFQHSINLAFVRILRDIVNYYTAANGISVKRLLGDTDDPQREVYLKRFIDMDSRRFLHRFYSVYKGMDGEQAMAQLAERTRPQAKQLATVYLSVHPDARIAHLQTFLMSRLPQWDLSENELWDLFLTYTPERLNLADRGYVAGVHPLELWLVHYLQQHPAAPWSEILDASGQVRQDAYSWLFKGNPHKQDTRIRILLEQDAFARIYENWKSLGYPFSQLVPSLGTAIGASGDRPDALANLIGTVMNGGVRVPTVTIEHLRFAAGTPYDTSLSPTTQPERVMPPEVAATVKRALTGVVESGTARRLSGTYVAANDSPLPVGGKTGTGDNRFERHGHGGDLISSKVVDRTATFVFFLGDRFFGTVTAYVPGPDAERFHFTSAIAVQFLKSLKPELEPLINGPSAPATAALVGSSPNGKPTSAASSPAAGR